MIAHVTLLIRDVIAALPKRRVRSQSSKRLDEEALTVAALDHRDETDIEFPIELPIEQGRGHFRARFAEDRSAVRPARWQRRWREAAVADVD